MRLTEAGFVAMTERVIALADRFAGGRVVAVLEGGYDPPTLGRAVAAVLTTLDQGSPHDEIVGVSRLSLEKQEGKTANP
jgi:acetoin utilization deacetylase AcuC-like enzyme